MGQNFKTLVDLWDRSTKKFESRELFGTKSSGSWTFGTFKDFRELTDRVRGGLKKLGVGPGDRVAMVANNRVEWAACAYATYGLRAAFVPMYEPQPADEWDFIANDCGAKVMIAATATIYDYLTTKRASMPTVQHVVGLHLPESDDNSFAALTAAGAKAPAPFEQPEPDEIAGYIYTSGTTGKPKGVLLSHKNFCANVNAIEGLFPITPEDRSLAFLPWSHSFGQTAELHSLMSQGMSIAINDEVPNLVGNLGEVKPTVLIAVPRIFNRIYDGVNKQMQAKPAPIRALFRAGVAAASKRSRGQSLGVLESMMLGLADKMIFKKIRGRVGGRLRFASCGSAALSLEVAEFVDALGIDIYEGYGLSETSPVVTTNYPGHKKPGTVGKPLPGVRVTIDKSATNDPKSGEIVVYGDNVMKGYHNRPEENAQVFSADGGLKTGDMGYVDDDGYLVITGRIKEQYKLETGKYVVPSPLEEQLKLSPFVANVMLFGDNKPHNVALVVADVDAVKRWAEQEGHELGDLGNDDKVKALIKEELKKYSETFKSYERPRDIAIVTEDFTVENGMLTPSLKLKRRTVMAKYGPKIQGLY
ncbi:MAG TPA: long-chain fatty acid--CoA ligase [Polyangiaceae bacterium]|nr:long-chain fatty acid--CoA ligase [Polyangiaceae bacterium]